MLTFLWAGGTCLKGTSQRNPSLPGTDKGNQTKRRCVFQWEWELRKVGISVEILSGNIYGDDKQGKMRALALPTAGSAMGLRANTSIMFFLCKDKGNEWGGNENFHSWMEMFMTFVVEWFPFTIILRISGNLLQFQSYSWYYFQFFLCNFTSPALMGFFPVY